MTRTKFIAVDFDGTITLPSKYPITGEIRPECVEVLKRLKEKYYLILWTHRTGGDLIDAIYACGLKGITFDFINENPLKGNYDGKKIFFDICIDDKNIGYTVDWEEIERRLLTEDTESE